jgi:hypothetical protein
LCDAYGGTWGGFAERADFVGSCGYCYDAGLYACGTGAFEEGASGASSAGEAEGDGVTVIKRIEADKSGFFSGEIVEDSLDGEVWRD